MISFDEALALTLAAARPLGAERVALRAAAGRVLAGPVVAGIDAPRFTVSTMDGYAVRDVDLPAGAAGLRIAGESFPGGGRPGALKRGECLRIFTGAPAPPGADRVVIQEVVRRDGDRLHLAAAAAGPRFLRERSSDFRRGETLLHPGRLLGARDLIAAAAADQADVEVARRPRLVLLATGDELAEPGQAAASAGKIPDSISPGVMALAEAWGGVCVAARRLADEPAGMIEAAALAVQQADVVVVAGGASVGEKDYAKAMFEPAGLDLIFSGVAMRPGRPVWFGRVGGTLVLGLPGNPTSAYVTARLLLAPLLAALGGREPGQALAWRTAAVATPVGAADDRETFYRGRWTSSPQMVEVLPNQDSGAQKALAEADCLVRTRPQSPAMPPGAPVEVLDL